MSTFKFNELGTREEIHFQQHGVSALYTLSVREYLNDTFPLLLSAVTTALGGLTATMTRRISKHCGYQRIKIYRLLFLKNLKNHENRPQNL